MGWPSLRERHEWPPPGTRCLAGCLRRSRSGSSGPRFSLVSNFELGPHLLLQSDLPRSTAANIRLRNETKSLSGHDKVRRRRRQRALAREQLGGPSWFKLKMFSPLAGLRGDGLDLTRVKSVPSVTFKTDPDGLVLIVCYNSPDRPNQRPCEKRSLDHLNFITDLKTTQNPLAHVYARVVRCRASESVAAAEKVPRVGFEPTIAGLRTSQPSAPVWPSDASRA